MANKFKLTDTDAALIRTLLKRHEKNLTQRLGPEAETILFKDPETEVNMVQALLRTLSPNAEEQTDE